MGQGGEEQWERSWKYKDGVMRKLTKREEIGEGKGLLHCYIPFHLLPLGSPIELAQVVCAVCSVVSARSINLRLGEAWGPDEVSWAAQCIGQRATTFLSSCLRGRPRILDTLGQGGGGPSWGDTREACGRRRREAIVQRPKL